MDLRSSRSSKWRPHERMSPDVTNSPGKARGGSGGRRIEQREMETANDHTRLSRQTVPTRVETTPAGAVPDEGFSRVGRRADSAHPPERLDLRARGGGRYEDQVVELGRVSCARSNRDHGGYSLCDALVEVRH
jgi:hypothetical protein